MHRFTIPTFTTRLTIPGVTRRHVIVGLLIAAAFLSAGTVSYLNRHQAAAPTSQAMLKELWDAYKKDALDPVTFRTLDKQKGNITTSEGQSYTMLRAAWEGDRPTFDISWQWAKDNLNRPTDSLPAWLWGERPDGTYGILTAQNGQNTASDADTDMALSLLFAGNRWHEPAYTDAGRRMIGDIWKQDVVTIQGKPVLTADNQEQYDPAKVIVNPSYFAPYAYTAFARLDPADDWTGLRSNMYALVSQAASQSLDTPGSANIPPDWIAVNRQTGSILASQTAGQTTHFSYDAIRLPFRLALDYQWNAAPEAKALLSHFGFLDQQWKSNGKIMATYDHQGAPIPPLQEASATYGATIGYFLAEDPAAATKIYDTKLLPLYDSAKQSWSKPLGYYDDNWAWFGMALYLNQLPNLAR